MMSALSTWSSLSTPVRILCGLGAGAGLVGVAGISGGLGLAMVVGGGLLVLVLILLLVRMVFLAFQRKKEKAIRKEMGEAGPSAGPTTAENRAQQEELRRRFLEGIEKFRAAGNNLYTMPWYLVLGEPGSGKTEAVRRCGIGFPPGLQDERQGWKGTVTMDWWFTNKAIFLDTAGRYTTESDNPAELTQLLKLLRRHRGNCPINGIILVVPANSLIQDSDAEIERKAGRIAQRLELIKRTLEVRFPVYFVVTKTDLIESFRWFFEGLDDPQLQHQVLGWAKPGTLDEPFKPEEVDQYLDQVRRRLLQRRMSLLADAGTGEDGDSRRIDRMDALYIFPDDLMRLAPRLKRYLELIFTPNPWSGKPSFFRGIFFTSSMRDGAALDQELAEALGVPVDSLPEGRVWDKEKPYFLRDLFNRKIFPELGLVTRAGDVGRMRRRRRAVLLGSGIAGVVGLIALTIFSAVDLRQRIGEQSVFWSGLSGAYNRALEENNPWRLLVSVSGDRPQYHYYGEYEYQVGDREMPLSRLLLESERQVRHPISRPRVFFWAAGGNVLEDERRQAHLRLMDAVFLQPLLEAAAARMGDDEDPGAWAVDDTPAAALALLMRIHSGTGLDAVDLDPLFRFVLVDEDELQRYRGDRELLNEAFVNTYGAEGHPPPALSANGRDLHATIATGIERLNAFWARRARQDPTLDDATRQTAAQVHELAQALDAFLKAERDLIALGEPVAFDAAALQTREDLDQAHDGWLSAMGRIEDSLDRIARMRTRLGETLDRTDALIDAARNELHADADRTYDRLLACLACEGSDPRAVALARDGAAPARVIPTANAAQGEDRTIEALCRMLQQGRRQAHRAMDDHLEGLQQQLEAMRTDLLARADSDEYAFELHGRLFQAAHKAVGQDVPHVGPEQLEQLLESLTSARRAAQRDTAELAARLPQEGEAGRRAGDIRRGVEFALDLAERRQRIVVVANLLDDAPADYEQVRDLVRAKAQDIALSPRQRLLPIPLSRALHTREQAEVPGEFVPEALERAVGQWQSLQRALGRDGENGDLSAALTTRQRRELLPRVEGAWRDFAEQYLRFWLRDLPEAAAYDEDPDRTWPDLHRELRRLQPPAVNEALERLAQRRSVALDTRHLPDSLLDDDDRERRRDTLESLAQQRQLLASRRFDESCQMIVRNWRLLPEQTHVAVRLLRGLTAERFRDDYFVYGDGHPYWNDLATDCLGLLAAHAQREAAQALDELRRLDAYPFVRDSTRSLTRQQILDARRAIDALPSPGTVEGTARERVIAAGGQTGIDRIDRLLEQFSGRGLTRDPAEARWLDQISALIEALVGTDEQPRWLTAELTFPGVSADDPVRTWFAEFRLRLGDAGPLPRHRVVRPDPAPIENLTAPGERIVLHFHAWPGAQQVHGRAVLGEDWPMLRLLQLEEAQRSDEDRTQWRIGVPVHHVDRDEVVGQFPLSLQLSREVPPPDDWPTRESWPR